MSKKRIQTQRWEIKGLVTHWMMHWVQLGLGDSNMLCLHILGWGWVAEAMEMMLLSFVGPAIQPEWGAFC
ncbi:hypothetical protein HanRHA438_Chr10g0468401 [Helianthus annuus]|nr:hypothetical protein HanRHA438_Chr10g0468401 [Helianthus annuus]